MEWYAVIRLMRYAPLLNNFQIVPIMPSVLVARGGVLPQDSMSSPCFK